MTERRRFRTWAEVEHLDDAELLEGYWDGFKGEPEPGGNRSDSYYHGWANGAVDGGHRENDEHQAAVARDWALRKLPLFSLP